MEVVMNLPCRYKEAVLLYYYQGLTMEETAETLGVAASTISTRLKKARQKLRLDLEEGITMFDRAPQDNELRRVMDACLPGLENRPDFDRDVLRQVRGEVKVKKKLSVGFVLVIVLVLAAVTALAAALLWEQQVVPMKEIEQAEGDYVNWSISQKQALIRA